jgi:hypothetical protein
MKFGLMSDVHLEFGEYEGPMGEGDTLLLAGDIHVAAYLASQHPQILAHDMAGRTERFMTRAFENYDQVVQVMGNHEHYQGLYDYTGNVLRAKLGAWSNGRYTLLDNEAIESEGVVIYGATMWTDFNGNDPLTKADAAYGMNDYRQIHKFDESDLMEQRKLQPDDVYIDHMAARQNLREITNFARSEGKKMVVMTHHAPSERSIHPGFRHSSLNPMYYSKMEHFCGDPVAVWVHGHVHHTHDYEINGTRVLCNPRGYVGHENTNFNPLLQFEVINA